jgi:hypothetical protein
VREVGKVDKGRLVKKLGKINLNTQKEVVAVLLEMFAE